MVAKYGLDCPSLDDPSEPSAKRSCPAMTPEDRDLLNKLLQKVEHIEEELTTTLNIPERVAAVESSSTDIMNLLQNLGTSIQTRDQRVEHLEQEVTEIGR